MCQVLRFLTAARAQQRETRGVGGKAGPTATLLLHSLRQAAFFSPIDPIAWHFLRPVVTPAFQVKPRNHITHFQIIETPDKGFLRGRMPGFFPNGDAYCGRSNIVF